MGTIDLLLPTPLRGSGGHRTIVSNAGRQSLTVVTGSGYMSSSPGASEVVLTRPVPGLAVVGVSSQTGGPRPCPTRMP